MDIKTNTDDPNQALEQNFLERPVNQPGISYDTSGQKNSAKQAWQSFYSANKYYVWAIFSGALIIAVLSYFAFKKPATGPVKQANIALTVSVPETVSSGGEALYKVTIQNNDSQKLTALQLELNYPEGSSYQSSSPKADNLSGTLFSIPDLISGQNAALFVKVRLLGNVNDQKVLNLKLHYKFSNFNSEFVLNQSAQVRLVASDINLELTGPSSANNAQLVLYSIKYKNNSAQGITSSRVKLTFPEGFVFASATPPPSLSNNIWDTGTLAKEGSGEIDIQGNFVSANPGESKTMQAEFLILGQDGQYFSQNSSSLTTAISSLPLLVTQQLTPDNGFVADPGQTLTFSINYQNNSPTVASGVNIEADLNSKVIDSSSVRAQGAQISNNSIIWNASGVSKLASLSPNQSGQLGFSFKINSPAVKDSSKNLTIVSNIRIKSNEYDSAFPGNQLNIKISSPAQISSALAYLSGSLPPQVGRSTTYKITLQLSNASNDYSGAVLTAFMPLASGGFVSGSAGAENGNVQFDPSTKKLTWTLGSLPAGTGKFSAPRTLTFNLVFNPSEAQIGQSPVLVSDINFAASDNFTGKNISIQTNNLTTGSLSGNSGFGNGTVQP